MGKGTKAAFLHGGNLPRRNPLSAILAAYYAGVQAVANDLRRILPIVPSASKPKPITIPKELTSGTA